MKVTKLLARIKRDELKLARYSRGVLLWGATALGQVLTAGIDAASAWTPRQWGVRLFVAGLAGAAGLITAGEKNPR